MMTGGPLSQETSIFHICQYHNASTVAMMVFMFPCLGNIIVPTDYVTFLGVMKNNQPEYMFELHAVRTVSTVGTVARGREKDMYIYIYIIDMMILRCNWCH